VVCLTVKLAGYWLVVAMRCAVKSMEVEGLKRLDFRDHMTR